VVDPERAFRRLISRLPSNFVSVDPASAGATPQFSSTDHLSSEAVAAFVDGELPFKAHLRAAGHLAACPQCSAEVDAQGQARAALRESRPVSMPSNLMGLLSQIPEKAPDESPATPPPPPPKDRETRGWRKRR